MLNILYEMAKEKGYEVLLLTRHHLHLIQKLGFRQRELDLVREIQIM
jgi:hypothetical protein